MYYFQLKANVAWNMKIIDIKYKFESKANKGCVSQQAQFIGWCALKL